MVLGFSHLAVQRVLSSSCLKVPVQPLAIISEPSIPVIKLPSALMFGIPTPGKLPLLLLLLLLLLLQVLLIRVLLVKPSFLLSSEAGTDDDDEDVDDLTLDMAAASATGIRQKPLLCRYCMAIVILDSMSFTTSCSKTT